jgi:plastocyanin
MLEDLWSGILDLTARFVIPDWGSIIALLPILILILVVIVLVWTFRRLRRAPAARRGKQRLEPRTPAGIHMPGPSLSPVFAAIGAFLLFLGLVFGGPILILGAIALTLTLLYWLAEALRTYDHDIGDTVPALPAEVHTGPPPGVHMPGPSFRPFLAAVGATMLFLGLVFGGWLLAAGVIALVLTLVGWLVDSVKEYRKTEEADLTGHLENIPAPRAPRALLWVIGILLVGGVVLQAGWLPPSDATGAEGSPPPAGEGPASGEPPASGEAPASGEPPASGEAPPAADVTLTARGVALVETSFTAPADQPFTIAFVNDDPSIPHNVEIRDGAGGQAFLGEVFPGVETRVYDVPALAAGSYTFLCTVHPSMTGTATVQ